MFRDYASTDTAEFVAVAFEEYLSGKVLDEAIETKEVIDMYMTALKLEYEAGQFRGTMKTKWKQEYISDKVGEGYFTFEELGA